MKDKPQYNILQNLVYLLKTCWRVSKGLLWMILAITILQLLTNMTELYIAPMILQKVERSVPLGEVLLTIGGFTLALVVFVGARSYLTETKPIFASRFFNHFFRANAMKSATTSYSNTMDTTFLEKREQSGNNMAGNSDATPPMVMLTQAAELVTACVGFVLYLLVLTGLHPIMMVLVIVTTVIGFCVNRYVNKKEFETHSEKLRCANRLAFVTNTAMSNEMPKDIRIFHMQPWLMELYDKTMALYQAYYNRGERRQFLAKLVDVILSAARNGIAYVYLIYMVIENDLPASQFLLYFSAVTGFTGWVTTILNSAIQLYRASNDLCEVREHLEWPEPFLFEEGKPVPRTANGQYELRLDHVSYRYPHAEADTITNMDLTIRGGEKLAIVGLNGAGKTTLVKLLCGLLDPTEGRVLLNGEDIRAYNRRDYYTIFTAVFQEFSRLQGSIAVNIAQTEQGYDRERVIQCAKRAGFWETIESFPKGIDTNLGRLLYDDGIELSGGQEQRMMLARALYKDAPILLLDEPTAALDPIAENDMYLRYNEIAQNRTAIYISHRLASTRFCDRVLFLQNGVIAEEGTHDELISLGGGYASLFEVQSRYYREGGAEDGE